MSLPVYDPDKHHIGLAPVGDPLHGLMLVSSYTRTPQRYGGSVKYGGTDDQIGATALSRWSQDDFSGGGYQDRFRDDAAMFFDSQNFLPHQVDDTARTVPPLVRWQGAGSVDPGDVRGVFATGGKILLMDSDVFRFYDADTGVRVDGSDPDFEIQAADHDPADNVTYYVSKKTADNSFHLYQVDPGDGTRNQVALMPTAANGPARGMICTAGRDFLISMNTTLWLADINDDRDDATFTRLGRLPGRWRDAVTHNGLTYILLTDSEQRTQLVSWDGTQILPVVTIPDNFIGNCIEVYGGRLYVAGTATDTAGTSRYAEIYEVTLGSLRLIKTFASERRANLSPPTTIFDMTVHEGLLFFGTDKGYLMAYDLTRDAIWPRVEIHSEVGHTIHAYNLLSTRERLIVYGFDATDGTKNGFYRMAAVNADMTAGGTNGSGSDVTATSYIETSEFSPEPDRLKRWSQLRVVSRYSPAPTLEISQDGGATWASHVALDNTGTRFITTDYDLSDLDPSESIRFRFSFAKSDVAYTELVAFTCSFLMLDSGKSGWSATVAGVDRPENLDGLAPEFDIAALKSTLWGYWTNKTTLTFRDTDGTDYTVFISDMQELQPTIDAQGEREAFFSLTLTEI